MAGQTWPMDYSSLTPGLAQASLRGGWLPKRAKAEAARLLKGSILSWYSVTWVTFCGLKQVTDSRGGEVGFSSWWRSSKYLWSWRNCWWPCLQRDLHNPWPDTWSHCSRPGIANSCLGGPGREYKWVRWTRWKTASQWNAEHILYPEGQCYVPVVQSR